jgi:broad specificity phosphatase PhoE
MTPAGETPRDCTILLVRHAHNGMAGRFCGELDPPLSEQGREQSIQLAEFIAKHPVTHIFSGDLRRAQQTASFIAAKSGLTIEVIPSLREIRFGEWEGLTWDEVSQKDAAYAQRWMEQYPLLPAPAGEEFRAFQKRVQAALSEVVAQSNGGSAVVVTHGGVIRTFLLYVLKLPESALSTIECEYASCIELRLQDGNWILPSEH